MLYVITVLAAVLIGLSIGAMLSRRGGTLLVGSLLAIVLAIAACVTGSWAVLAAGVVVYLVAQVLQRDSKPAHS